MVFRVLLHEGLFAGSGIDGVVIVILGISIIDGNEDFVWTLSIAFDNPGVHILERGQIFDHVIVYINNIDMRVLITILIATIENLIVIP